jgi:hypothetical protein
LHRRPLPSGPQPKADHRSLPRTDYEHFPLYPGETAWIEYGYEVTDEKWGNWYQRAVRLPTRHLAVRLVFPSELDAMVWGIETSLAAEALPFRTAIEHHQEYGHDVFTWSTEDQPSHPLPVADPRLGRLPESRPATRSS